MSRTETSIILDILSKYLNNYPTIIKKKDILNVVNEGVSEYRAYLLLLQSFFNIDRDLFNKYFPRIVKEENKENYIYNPYFVNVRPKEIKYKKWEIKYSSFKPYEGFVRDDFKEYIDEDMILPQIGYFKEEFKFLSIYQDGRLWMSITPNEINTMKKPIEKAHGVVTTLGLGLGYFAYMASIKDNVKKVRIVEIDDNVIKLFREFILPFFPDKEKIEIIHMDALEYLKRDFECDYLFCDIWHDVSDGLPLYKKIKEFENKHPKTTFDYWIYDTIKCYLK